MAARKIVRKHKAFIEAFKVTASITKAAKAAGVDRAMHYEWMEVVPGYRELFEAAKDEAVRRAHEGVTQAIFYEGKPVGAKRIYSDTLIIFLLKALRPEKYRERVAAELTGPNGGPIELRDDRLKNLTDDQLADLIRITRVLAADGGDRSGDPAPSAQ